jgi:two-component system response regulator PilR (NtrC family)
MLRNLVNTALRLSQTASAAAESPDERILGRSPAIITLKQTIKKLARSQAPVYVRGESGSGKELVAREIHAQGPRADRPFVPVNCGAIPGELMESEFFGHVKGSFTGAVADKQGLFQAADGGSLFLDEIAELPLHMQVKLLRAIQERAVKPVGAHLEIPVDVRIVSATHKDLAAEVQAGHFRQDLYYRINVIELPVPPLRERAGDMAELGAHLLAKIASGWGSEPITLTDEAVRLLQGYAFPGNVREFENILERAATLCEGERIDARDIQLPDTGTGIAEPVQDTEAKALNDVLDDTEKQAIIEALEKTRWNRTQAAKLLGLSFRQLRYRLKKLGIE